MYAFEDKLKRAPADIPASHPSMNGRRQADQQAPIVHVDFGSFATPSHQTQPLRAVNNHRLTDEEDLVSQRFVAGQQFYNYEMYGSLRKGTAVSFFSWQCFGLMAAVFTSALSYQCLQSTTRPYMNSQLQLSYQNQMAVQRLVELPMTLSFFIGLLSDGYPIMGLRRKGYMIVGLALNTLSVIALGVVSMYFETLPVKETRPSWLVILSIVLIAFASMGCIITYLCVHTRVIELSQREPLRRRGAIIAEYLIFRRLTSFVGAGYAFFIFGWAGATGRDGVPRIPFSTAMFILAFLCTAPLPLILRYWKEEHYNLSTTMKVRCKIFWKIMQQKAVWRVLMFIMVFALFLSIKFYDSANLIKNWAGASSDNVQVVRCIADAISILTVLCWRSFFMNTLWARFFCWAPILQVVPGLLSSVLVSLDWNRNRYVYRSIMSVSNIADAITTLNPVVPLVEIIQEGSEGVTVGLTLSLYRIINIFVSTNSQGLFRGENFYNTTDAGNDTLDARYDVMWSTVIVYSINAIALVGLFFLPSQKLDAQQLRMYGGFTKSASSAIVIFALSFFLYSTTINIMTFIPSLSCYPLVGGKGCK